MVSQRIDLPMADAKVGASACMRLKRNAAECVQRQHIAHLEVVSEVFLIRCGHRQHQAAANDAAGDLAGGDLGEVAAVPPDQVSVGDVERYANDRTIVQ